VSIKKFAPLALVLILASGPTAADARPDRIKSIWGPVEFDGRSQFPIYEDLGVGLFQTTLRWDAVAAERPAHARDPRDPAYAWPTEIDTAVRRASRRGIAVSILLNGAPGWANGQRAPIWAPNRPKDFADFAFAASRRYPDVHHWMIWGEPSKSERFQPLVPAMGRRLTAAQRRGPRIYARILDASYAALKHQDRRNLVIGGNTWTGGQVLPLNFIKAMRLPSGRRPRMDLYGHNPFTLREPNLTNEPLGYGYADFSDLDALAGWLDRYGYRDRRHRRLRLFLSEFVLPTDHASVDFSFWLSRDTQAKWLGRALRISRRFDRIYTLGYLGLYDDPPRADGLEVNRGLIDRFGRKKPAYRAFKRG
jgi:hypothetical protein